MRMRLRKILVGVSALAALALGGAAISQAGSSSPPQKSAEPATEQEQNSENSATDPDNVQDENGNDDSSERGEKGEKEESDKPVTGDASSRAKQAALAEVGGKAGDVERDGDNGGTYEVEVTKADGKEVDVYLDAQYKVVAVDQDNEQQETSERAGATK